MEMYREHRNQDFLDKCMSFLDYLPSFWSSIKYVTRQIIWILDVTYIPMFQNFIWLGVYLAGIEDFAFMRTW